MTTNTRLFSTLLFSVLITSHMFADMSGNKLSLNAGKSLLADGEFKAQTEINFSSKGSFEGKGYLEAPIINITTKTFEFTGTINCSGKCTIIAEEKFDTKMFKRKGNGEFIIKIEVSEASKIDKFINAGLNNDAAEIKNMLDKNPELKDKALTFAMLAAGQNKHLDLVKELIVMGADVNGSGLPKEADAPIILAMAQANIPFLKILLEAGANPNVFTHNNEPAILYAVAGEDCAKDCLIELLNAKNKINIDATNETCAFETALIWTSAEGCKELVEILLAAGANINAKTAHGQTALSLAQANNQWAIVKLLEAKLQTQNNMCQPEQTLATFNEPQQSENDMNTWQKIKHLFGCCSY